MNPVELALLAVGVEFALFLAATLFAVAVVGIAGLCDDDGKEKP